MSQVQDTLPFKQLSLYSFDNFLDNEPVVSSLKEYSRLPQFCFLRGDKYTGKTHLFSALAECLLADEIPHLLLASSVLTQTDISAVLPAKLAYLILDDIDQLKGDQSGELALFNLFNYCKNNSIKLLVSSAIHAKDDSWELPDLVSRLNSGLTFQLKPLRGNEALQCIAKQFNLNGMPLGDSVTQYLQAHYSSAYPALFRLFLSVSAASLKLKRKVTVPLIKQAIKDIGC